jgi:hypothetical protein
MCRIQLAATFHPGSRASQGRPIRLDSRCLGRGRYHVQLWVFLKSIPHFVFRRRSMFRVL